MRDDLHDHYFAEAQSYLETLCSVRPNRRTGSEGNRQATEFCAATLHRQGYEIDVTPFDCLDYVSSGAALTRDDEAFDVCASPYSLGCDVLAQLVSVSTIEELESSDCEGKILLLRGDICSEQLMPKNFVFYNPERHRRIVSLLERRRPAGIVTATARNPEQVGALYPYPLILDGDFDIPSVFCRDSVGNDLASRSGQVFRLRIDAGRLPSSATNVVARLNGDATQEVVLTAHIDAYEDTPGASDNASGVVVLLLAAEILSGYGGERCIEVAVLNGEDHYSAGGQMDYLRRYGGALPGVVLAVNVDDVGYRRGRTSYSFYSCPPQLETDIAAVFRRFRGLTPGEQWFSGDHMIFVQSHVPALALTAECMLDLMRTVTHTAADTPELVDCHKLVEVAEALSELVRTL